MTKYYIIEVGRTTKQISGEIFQHGDRWFGLSPDGNCTDLLTGAKVLSDMPDVIQAKEALEEDFTLLAIKHIEKEQPEKYKFLYDTIKACYSPGTVMYKRLYGGGKEKCKL